MEKREQGFANTGTLLSEEMETNLFIVAFLESHKETRLFSNWVRANFLSLTETEEEQARGAREKGISAIGTLRQNRSSHDTPINARGAEIRAAQAGQNTAPRL